MWTKDGNDAQDKASLGKRLNLEAPEVQQARNASEQTMSANEKLRTNASDGSLGDKLKPGFEQDESIQIMGASGLSASRKNKISEKDLTTQNHAAISIDVRELLAKPDRQAQELVEEFGRVLNMPAGFARDAALLDVQELADKTYKRGKYANNEDSATVASYKNLHTKEQPQEQFLRLEFFDRATEDAEAAAKQVLIASNIVPNIPKLDQKQQYQDIKSDSTRQVAQGYDGCMPLPTPIPSPEQLGITPEIAKALTKAANEVIEPWTKDHPLADRENEIMAQMTATNAQAWNDAKNAFPRLNNVSINIMQAYTRNEIANYNRFDLKDDIDAASAKVISLPGRPADQATLGISQISPKGIREFEDRYPQFKAFLEKKGYVGLAHELAALLDPECAPMIVAAKTASIVEDMQKHGIKNPTVEQIAYAYNPDVYSYFNGHDEVEYKTLYQLDVKISASMHPDQKKEYYANRPDIIATSSQVRNVMVRLHRHDGNK